MAANLQTLTLWWRDFDLPGLQRELDVTAMEIANKQDESDNSRKHLVELSREFKKSTSEEVRKAVVPLLKSFQAEVDSLLKRSKSSETAFLNVYKKLLDTADPVPVLEYCVGIQQKLSKLSDMEIENKQLRETLNEYNQEFKEVKNQEVTIKQLEKKIRQYEVTQEEELQAHRKELEKEFVSQFAEKEKELCEQQLIVAQKLGVAEQRIAELQTALDQSQSELFDTKVKYEEVAHAKSDESEMIMNDLERANQHAALAEKEVATLMEQLAIANENLMQLENSQQPQDVEQSINVLNRTSMEVELEAKEKEVSQLVNDVQELQAKSNHFRESTSMQIKQLEEQLHQRTQQLKKMEARLEMQKDYEELRRELNILKSIEFPDGSFTEEKSNKPLELLLLEKTKISQAENTSLKVASSELQGRHDRLMKEHDVLLQRVVAQKQLITQLEHDLSNVKSLSTLYRGEGEGSSSSTDLLAEVVKETTGSPLPFSYTSSPNLSQSAAPDFASPPDFASAAETLLPIVQSQRERFKLRNQELESQGIQHQHQISLLQNEVDQLRSDNIKLYEKIRYLQSYPLQKSQSQELESGAESRYHSQYEERLDPFSSFSKKERQRKYAQLSPFEKVTLSMGQFVLSNKVARTVTFIYTVLLHCLIFLVLYMLAHSESCRRDVASDCAQRFAEHMHNVHGYSKSNG